MSQKSDGILGLNKGVSFGVLSSVWYRFRSSKPLFWSTVLVISWRLVLELDNQFFALLRKPLKISKAVLHLDRWSHWDGGWYMGIVENGYHHIHLASGQQNFVFFPVFPISTRWVAYVLHISNPLYVGLMLNLLLTIGIAFFLYRLSCLIVLRYGDRQSREQAHAIALTAILVLLLYPSSFFFAAFYSEGFLVFGATAAVYYALEGRLLYSGIFAGLATGSKSLGFVVLPTVAAIILEQWLDHKTAIFNLLKRWCYVLIGLWGGLAYAIYLAAKFGDPLLPYKLEKEWGRQKSGFFLTNLTHLYYNHLFQFHYFHTRFNYLLNILVMALPFLVLGIGIWVTFRYKTFWPLVLCFFTLAMPLSTGIMLSLNRYVLVIAPVAPFIAIASVSTATRRRVLVLTLLLSSLFLLYFTAGFLQGGYFAG
jgi:hypothetical protein